VRNIKQAEIILRRLDVEKVIVSSAPDNSAHFTGTVDSQVNLTWDTTNGVAVTVANNLLPGTYHVHEDAKAGFVLLGFATLYNTGAACPDEPTAKGSSGTAVLTESDTFAKVCVYNQPRVNIKVTKAEIIEGASSPGQGWKITVSGCGFTDSHPTAGSDASYTFSDLAPCTYTVSEDASSKTGYVPLVPSSVEVIATAAGHTYEVNFINVKFGGCVGEACLPVIVTLTPSPTPPTPTPPTPTATVTEVTFGEKVASPTAIAPETGSGLDNSGGTTNILLAAAGLIALSGGMATLALSHRKSRN
jgi:hypothetical protein